MRVMWNSLRVQDWVVPSGTVLHPTMDNDAFLSISVVALLTRKRAPGHWVHRRDGCVATYPLPRFGCCCPLAMFRRVPFDGWIHPSRPAFEFSHPSSMDAFGEGRFERRRQLSTPRRRWRSCRRSETVSDGIQCSRQHLRCMEESARSIPRGSQHRKEDLDGRSSHGRSVLDVDHPWQSSRRVSTHAFHPVREASDVDDVRIRSHATRNLSPFRRSVPSFPTRRCVSTSSSSNGSSLLVRIESKERSPQHSFRECIIHAAGKKKETRILALER